MRRCEISFDGQVAGSRLLYDDRRRSGVAAQARQAFFRIPGSMLPTDLKRPFSDYHALQLELRRDLREGCSGRSTTREPTPFEFAGTSQQRFEPFLDNARPELDEGRSQFHVSHVINAT